MWYINKRESNTMFIVISFALKKKRKKKEKKGKKKEKKEKKKEKLRICIGN